MGIFKFKFKTNVKQSNIYLNLVQLSNKYRKHNPIYNSNSKYDQFTEVTRDPLLKRQRKKSLSLALYGNASKLLSYSNTES